MHYVCWINSTFEVILYLELTLSPGSPADPGWPGEPDGPTKPWGKNETKIDISKPTNILLAYPHMHVCASVGNPNSFYKTKLIWVLIISSVDFSESVTHSSTEA